MRKQKEPFIPLDEKSFQVASPESDSEERVNLQMAINQLKEVDKAITLLYLEECSYQDIAYIIGISASNVGYKLHEIKKKLRKSLNY